MGFVLIFFVCEEMWFNKSYNVKRFKKEEFKKITPNVVWGRDKKCWRFDEDFDDKKTAKQFLIVSPNA